MFKLTQPLGIMLRRMLSVTVVFSDSNTSICNAISHVYPFKLSTTSHFPWSLLSSLCGSRTGKFPCVLSADFFRQVRTQVLTRLKEFFCFFVLVTDICKWAVLSTALHSIACDFLANSLKGWYIIEKVKHRLVIAALMLMTRKKNGKIHALS